MILINHLYVSTACQHAKHDYCNADIGQKGPKNPQTCKWCSAKCLCTCHHEEPEGER